MKSYDVVVAGGGNAALCAAIAARRAGASVMLIERTAREWRGGNSKYTRNVRVAHGPGDPVMPGEYTEDELLEDLRRVTGEGFNVELARLAIEQSKAVPDWMEQNGVLWQQAFRGTLHLGRTNRFFLGGGKALMNTYFRVAEALGVDVRYESTVTQLTMSGGRCSGVVIEAEGGHVEIPASAVVAASGGFEANLEWLREYWGDAVDNYSIRGSEANDGRLLRGLLDLGAGAAGNPRGFHAVAVDARSPRYEGGIVTRVDSVPFSVMLNRGGHRFYDEGEDLWPKRYATWGRLIAEQPGQRAFSFYDSRVQGRFMAGAYPPVSGGSVEEVAAKVGLDPRAVRRTIDEYNASLVPGEYDPSRLDGCHTSGLTPPKSHWALPIDRPPFYCFALMPGITFTYLGVAIDSTARVVQESGKPFENVFAAGEIMAGNILLRGYLAGFGMTIGTVFGRRAGEGAAAYVRA